MTIKELLVAQGVTEEQATKITTSMKENKLFISNQENLDIRYEKLKTKHDDLAIQVNTANTTIEGLKKDNKDNEGLQTTLAKYKTDYETLKTESATKIKNIGIDSQIKNLMKEYKVKDKYDELLMNKIDRNTLELDDKGSVTGLKDIFDGLKTDYADLFVAEPPKLGGTPPANNGSSTNNISKLEETIKNSIKF